MVFYSKEVVEQLLVFLEVVFVSSDVGGDDGECLGLMEGFVIVTECSDDVSSKEEAVGLFDE